jgi:hypothetical protein
MRPNIRCLMSIRWTDPCQAFQARRVRDSPLPSLSGGAPPSHRLTAQRRRRITITATNRRLDGTTPEGASATRIPAAPICGRLLFAAGSMNPTGLRSQFAVTAGEFRHGLTNVIRGAVRLMERLRARRARIVGATESRSSRWSRDCFGRVAALPVGLPHSQRGPASSGDRCGSGVRRWVGLEPADQSICSLKEGAMFAQPLFDAAGPVVERPLASALALLSVRRSARAARPV